MPDRDLTERERFELESELSMLDSETPHGRCPVCAERLDGARARRRDVNPLVWEAVIPCSRAGCAGLQVWRRHEL